MWGFIVGTVLGLGICIVIELMVYNKDMLV